MTSSWFQSDTVTATCTGPDWSPEAPQCTRVSCAPLQPKLDQSVQFTASKYYAINRGFLLKSHSSRSNRRGLL